MQKGIDMLRTIPIARSASQPLRLLAIMACTLLMALSAKISIEVGPVPFTLQPLVVLLTGMVLGARDGAASMALYVLLIASGQPLDARGLGAAVFAGPTWGYLVGFIPAAFVTGWLVESGAQRVWQRWLAGIVGVLVIYVGGVPIMKMVLGLDWAAAWEVGAAPFLGLDIAKALLAALLVETTRAFLLRDRSLQDSQ